MAALARSTLSIPAASSTRFVLGEDDVREVTGGFLVVAANEVVPHGEVPQSKERRYWRCKKTGIALLLLRARRLDAA